MTATVRLTRRADGYRVEFRYDPTLVPLVKTVPAHARSYDSTSKHWHVFDPFGERV